MKMSKMKLKKTIMQPTLADSAKTAVSVALTSPSSAAVPVLTWPVELAPAMKRKKMYGITFLSNRIAPCVLTTSFKQDEDMPELEGEEKGDKKIQEVS